ncbi:MAG: hypothetical protein J5544_05575, partial [Clostridia bacterium]|nr:hypothetical protein [Clostridia bacterium]
MKNNSLKSKPVLVTVIAVVLLIVLIVISAGSRSANVIESAAGTVLTPIQGFAVRASNAIAGFFGKQKWIGLGNFRVIFANPLAMRALKNTVIIAFFK